MLSEHENARVELVMGERSRDDVECLFDTVESDSLFWTDLQELSFYLVCVLHLQCKVMCQDWDSPEQQSP